MFKQEFLGNLDKVLGFDMAKVLNENDEIKFGFLKKSYMNPEELRREAILLAGADAPESLSEYYRQRARVADGGSTFLRTRTGSPGINSSTCESRVDTRASIACCDCR